MLTLILALLAVFILGMAAGMMLTRYLIQRELKRTMTKISDGAGGLDLNKMMEMLAPPRTPDN